MKLPLPAALALALTAIDAGAADYCVGNSAQLWNALHYADQYEGDVRVRLKAGTISVDANYYAVYSSGSGKNLYLLGGNNDDCSALAAPGAKTVIDGAGAAPIAYLSTYGVAGNIALARIVWRNGASDSANAAVTVNTTASLTVLQNGFLHNVGSDERPTAIYLNVGKRFAVRNSVFAHNASPVASNVRTIVFGSNGADDVSYITSNTITDNVGPGGVALYVESIGTRTWSFANNILYANSANYTLHMPALVELRNNDIDQISGTPTVDTGNVSVDPQFVASGPGSDYHLSMTSPLVDAGLAAGVPGGLGTRDYDDADRVQGAGVDIGAYEGGGDAIFADGFDPFGP